MQNKSSACDNTSCQSARNRNRRSLARLGARAALAGFFAATASFAQLSGGGGPAGGMPGSSFPSGHRSITDRVASDTSGCATSVNYGARASEALLATKDALRLNQDQEPLWGKFEARVRLMLADALKSQGGHGISVLTMHAPQLDEQVLDPARDQLTALEDVNDSSKILYGALTAEQQAVADARLPVLFHLLVAEAMRSVGAGADPR